MVTAQINLYPSRVGYLTKAMSFPHIGNLMLSLFYSKIIASYDSVFLQLSGFQLYIKDLSVQEAKECLKMHNRFLKIIELLEHNHPETNNQHLVHLIAIITKIANKLRDNIELLEDIITPNYAYSLNSEVLADDWNSPENDHWDNY